VIATDVGQSFRAKEYVEYKAQRDRMPDNLRSQIDGVFALFDAADIQILSKEGFEADDIIGSLVMERSNGWTEYQFIIISSDKDLCQFVQDGHIHIYDAMKRKFMKEKDVLEKFSVPVQQVRDYLAIV
jgi:DNA polymerase-1